MSNLSKSDQYIKTKTRLTNCRMNGANNTKINGNNINIKKSK